MSRERIQKSPQSGRNTPNEGFFNSKNYTELDCIQRRAKMLADASLVEREDKLNDDAEEQHRLELEQKRKAAALERSKKESRRGPCDVCIKAANRATQRNESKLCKKILRRPIAPRCTCMDPTDGQLPVLAIEYPVDIDDWAYKPFSTIVSGGAVGYRGLFPLLMQKCTEAEEKDSLQVQTETRRHSVVTTDYLTGRIKLESTGHKVVNLSVFPLLHVVLSDSEDEDESSSSDAGDDDEQDELADLRSHAETEQSTSEHEVPTPRRRSGAAAPAPDRQQQRRRSSTTPGPLPGRRPQGSPRVVRRKSIDHSSLALSFAKALEAAMTPISEEAQEKRAVSPGEEFDVKHAEETMIHMEQNLQTLERFLQGGSNNSVSNVSSDDSL